jgi:hypothetical protein
MAINCSFGATQKLENTETPQGRCEKKTVKYLYYQLPFFIVYVLLPFYVKRK